MARLTIWFVAGYSIWQGAGIWHDGPARFGGPSFQLLRLVNHAVEPSVFWGGWLITAGCALLVASILGTWWLKLAALIGIAVWSAVFAVGGWLAYHDVPTTAGTGFKTYGLIVLLAIPLSFVDERKRRPPNARY